MNSYVLISNFHSLNIDIHAFIRDIKIYNMQI